MYPPKCRTVLEPYYLIKLHMVLISSVNPGGSCIVTPNNNNILIEPSDRTLLRSSERLETAGGHH